MHVHVSECVRVCVRACVCVCACVRVRVCGEREGSAADVRKTKQNETKQNKQGAGTPHVDTRGRDAEDALLLQSGERIHGANCHRSRQRGRYNLQQRH